MHQRAIIMTVVLFGLIVLGMFTFAYLKRGEIAEQTNAPVPQVEVPYPSVTRIDAKHFFLDGIHTLVGEITMPTPCDLLEVEALVAESYPEQVTIDFNVRNNSDNCVQLETTARFKVSASASEVATFRAIFMGRPVELNLIPAVEGETPDNYEVFIKG